MVCSVFLGDGPTVTYHDKTPMSEILRQLAYLEVREFLLPYEKRCYITDKLDLATNGYVDWVVDRVDEIENEANNNGSVRLSLQAFGVNMMKNNSYLRPFLNPAYSAHSWRGRYVYFYPFLPAAAGLILLFVVLGVVGETIVL